jgi:alkylation response protein AidB-like acyl-CoA dehydrogenase
MDAHVASMSEAEETAFRQEVREFCLQCPDAIRDVVRRQLKLSRKQWEPWQRLLHARGWGATNWPRAFGGTGWDAKRRQLFDEVLAECDCPPPHHQGLRHIGPVLMKFGTKEQQDRLLPGILQGTNFWCQGYSEPGAGSDLASLRTRAERDGEDYVVNGQKIWTTGAHEADWMFALVRTATGGRKQEGITLLLLPMDSPGLTVRPIPTIDRWHHVNEVFFNDVRVPVANRVGEEGQAWEYGKYLLQHERLGPAAAIGQLRRSLERAREHVAACLSDEADRARRLALEARLLREEAELLALREIGRRSVEALIEGQRLGNAPSVLKLASSEMTQRISEIALDASGRRLAARFVPIEGSGPNAEIEGVETVHNFLYLRSRTIVAGTTEVQKNLIARSLFGN